MASQIVCGGRANDAATLMVYIVSLFELEGGYRILASAFTRTLKACDGSIRVQTGGEGCTDACFLVFHSGVCIEWGKISSEMVSELGCETHL